MSEQLTIGSSQTAQTITARVLAECRKTYGSTIDDHTLEVWVDAVVSSLLDDQTRVTQFVPLLAMRDIRERASHYIAGGA